jgi:hypothetical protein
MSSAARHSNYRVISGDDAGRRTLETAKTGSSAYPVVVETRPGAVGAVK